MTAEPVTEAVTALLALARARGPRCGAVTVLAVDGRSGSGKTTLAAVVTDRLRADGTDPVVLHLDDAYPGWDGLSQTPPALAESLLRPLGRGRAGCYRRWDWIADRPGGLVEIPRDTAWLVLEGVGAGTRPIRPWLSALAWLEAPTPVRRRRGLDRDGESYAPHWERWARQEDALLAGDPVHDHADVQVDTRD
ncbi:hypothetical protein [Arsenicicoccus dermatophilus]|uniref:hypothetical protein n=1 Tax=Arsenicicoccus dermatophilus TaxID=1076331 RepID=UPI001F4CFF98|nr:hypothetical protein [Arsenicicoccus dermatophilus]MCH8613114.1 hypothetical protein [Arsenicicoccus dermatophilus]